jgi:hypothetical protein
MDSCGFGASSHANLYPAPPSSFQHGSICSITAAVSTDCRVGLCRGIGCSSGVDLLGNGAVMVGRYGTYTLCSLAAFGMLLICELISMTCSRSALQQQVSTTSAVCWRVFLEALPCLSSLLLALQVAWVLSRVSPSSAS